MKKTELYIEKFRLDLFPDESFLLNYSLTDITEIGSKTGGYSKELKLPATKNNNQIFSYLYDVNVESYFNPIIRKSATLYIDSLPVMTGYFKLTKVTTVDNKYHQYVGLLFEQSPNLISALGDSVLSDLNVVVTGTTRDLTTYDAIIDINTFSTATWYDTRRDEVNAWCLNYDAIVSGSTLCSLVDVTRTKEPQLLDGYWVDDQVSSIVVNTAGIYKWDFRFVLISTTIAYPSFEYYIIHNSAGTDIDIAYGNFPNSGGLPLLYWILNLQNIVVDMAVGDSLRLELWSYGSDYTVDVTPATDYTFKGYAYTGATTNVGYKKLDINYITNNIYNVTDSDDDDIVFPLVDYSRNYSMDVSPSNIQSLNMLRVNHEDLRPAIFIKKIWDEIFNSVGFRYDSDFIESDLFKKLILLGGVKEDDLYNIKFKKILENNYELVEPRQDRELEDNLQVVVGYEYRAFMLGGELADWDNTFTYNAYQELIKNKFSYDGKNTIYKQTFGYYGTDFGYMFYARTNGKYAYKVNLSALSKPVTLTDNATVMDYGLCYRLRVMKLKNGAYSTDPAYGTLFVNTNGTYTFTNPYLEEWEVIEEATFTRMNDETNQAFTLTLQGDVKLKQGDYLRAILLCSANDQVLGTTFPTDVLHSQTTLYKDDTYVEFAKLGDYVNFKLSNLSQLLPRDMKQKDFIINIAKMFNLYIETDKIDPKLLLIEPRDDYYDKGNTLDYSKKLDISKPIEQTIISHNQPKYINFNFKNVSNDYWTEKYKQFVGSDMQFGGYKFTSPNEYVTNNTKNDVIFAATYLQAVNDTNIIIPKIIDKKIMEADYKGDDGAFFYVDPRILYYGGMLTLPDTPTDNYMLLLRYYSVVGELIEKPFEEYGYAGHLNNPWTPTIDINWFSDLNYLPHLFSDNTSTSSDSINLSTLDVDDSLTVTISTGMTAFSYSNDYVKYVKVYDRPNLYVVGKITAYNSGSGELTLSVVDYYGTGTNASWAVILQNVKIKDDLYSYYEQEMIELTDAKARLMKCNLYLTPLDINQLRFNNILFINNEYWRLYSIKDFDTSSDINETTEVELLRVLDNNDSDINTLKGGFSDTSAGIITERVSNPNTGEISAVRNNTQRRYISLNSNFILRNSDNEVPYHFTTNLKPVVRLDYRAEMEVNNAVTHTNATHISELYPLSVGDIVEIDPIGTGDTDYTIDYGEKRIIIVTTPEDNMININLTLPTLSESYDDGYKIVVVADNIEVVANIHIVNANVNISDFRFEAGTEVVLSYFYAKDNWYINFK